MKDLDDCRLIPPNTHHETRYHKWTSVEDPFFSRVGRSQLPSEWELVEITCHQMSLTVNRCNACSACWITVILCRLCKKLLVKISLNTNETKVKLCDRNTVEEYHRFISQITEPEF